MNPSDAAIHNFHIDLGSKPMGGRLSFLQDTTANKAQEAKLLILKEDVMTDKTLLLDENAPLNVYHHHIDNIIESMGWSQPLSKPFLQPDPPRAISTRAEKPMVENTHYNDNEDIPPKLNYDEEETEIPPQEEEDTTSKLDYDEEETPTHECNKSYALPYDYQLRRHDVLVDCRESPGFCRFRVVAAMRVARYLNGEDVYPEMLDAVRQAGGSFVKQVHPETVDEEKQDGTPRDENVKYIDIGNDKARELALHEILESLIGVSAQPKDDLKASVKSKVVVPLSKEPKVDESPPMEPTVDVPLSEGEESTVNVSLPEGPKVVVPLSKELTGPIPTRLNNLRYIPRVDTTGESYPLPENYKVKADDIMVGLLTSYPGNTRFQMLARARAERYRATVSRLDKQSIIDEIVLIVRGTGAHFVRLEDGVYVDIGDHKARERTIYELKKAVLWWEAQHPDKVATIKTETAVKGKKDGTNRNKSDTAARELKMLTRRFTFLDNEIWEMDEPSDIMQAIQELTSLKRPRDAVMPKENNLLKEMYPSTAPCTSVKKPRRVPPPPLDSDEDDAALRERAKEDLRVRSDSSRSRTTRLRKGLPSYVIEALTKRTRKPTSGRSYKKVKPNLGPSNEESAGTDTGNTAEVVVSV
jgi:hypothetical protein